MRISPGSGARMGLPGMLAAVSLLAFAYSPPAAAHPRSDSTAMSLIASSSGPAKSVLARAAYDETRNSKRCATKRGWDGSFAPGPAVGYTTKGSCAGAYRTYFQFNIRSLMPRSGTPHLVTAVLHVSEISRASAGCSQRWPVRTYAVTAIAPRTDWRNQPVLQAKAELGTMWIKPGASSRRSCKVAALRLPLPAPAISSLGAPARTWTVALVGDERRSGRAHQFMYFSKYATLTVTYDVTPAAPASADLQTVTSGGTKASCASATSPWLDEDAVSLAAELKSAVSGEPVSGQFRLLNSDGSLLTAPVSAYARPAANGAASISVPAAVTLQDGHQYRWQVAAAVSGDPAGSDGPYVSALSPYCSFGVDLTPPLKPAITVGDSGSFTFSSSDPVPACAGCEASGVAGFRYNLDGPADQGSYLPATTAGGTATASTTVTIVTYGTHTLNVVAIDGAGNESDTAQYSSVLTSPNQIPLIYSLQFPPSGSTLPPGTAGQTGTFTFSSDNAVDSSCSPHPCGTDIIGFSYALNTDVLSVPPVINAPAVVTGDVANARLTMGIGDWGTTYLYVEAVDANGDITTPIAYQFYAISPAP